MKHLSPPHGLSDQLSDQGASFGTGSRASTEPASGLGPAGFDPSRIATLFGAIAHGDDEHRGWLRQAIEDHFAGRPVQSATGAASREMRLKLDRRIHNQRRALRENWEIVEQRQHGARYFHRVLIKRAGRLCDLLGVPKGDAKGRGVFTLPYRMDLAAQAIEAASADETHSGSAEGKSAVPQGCAPTLPGEPQ